jgi:hypothetical protein
VKSVFHLQRKSISAVESSTTGKEEIGEITTTPKAMNKTHLIFFSSYGDNAN